MKMNILIACEESQAITIAMRNLGLEAFSCDTQKCSGNHPEWHFNCDVFEIINNNGGTLQNGETHFVPKWDMMIAHPPCTYLSVSGARWLYNTDGSKNLERWANQKLALDFVRALMNVPIERIAIENPISVISSQVRKPDQIVHPYMFGDEASKATCLWLKNLPLLVPTNVVGKGDVTVFSSGKKMQTWIAKAYSKSTHERRKLRSKTFLGIANAIAEQWGKL